MKIAVFGASGHTARFVLDELRRRAHDPVPIDRSVASLNDMQSLDRALHGAGAVINCAGPFLDTAAPLIEAALRNRVHYFDLTAEQESARTTLEAFDGRAREHGVFVVPAVGFYGGLGDVMATYAMGDWTYADRIDIAIALDHWWPTRGTRLTGKRNTFARVAFSDGVLRALAPQQPGSWTFPQPFGEQEMIELPFTETILMARHLRVREIHNFLNSAPLREIRDPNTPPPATSDERGRSDQHFAIDVVVHKGAEQRRVSATGRDIYAITAPLVIESVERVFSASNQSGGTFALGELVDAGAFLQSLSDSSHSGFVLAASVV